MPRVLAIGSAYPPHAMGGYEVVWQSAMRWLRDRNDDVRVLTTDLRAEEALAEEDPDVHRELRWYWRDNAFPPISQVDRLRLERHNRAVLLRHISGFDPDVVSWWSMGGMSLSMIEQVRSAGLPAVGYVGDDWLDYGPVVDAWSRAWSRRAAGRVVGALTRIPTRLDPGAAAIWHFNSGRTLDWARRFGWKLPRVVVTPSGVDLGLFEASPPTDWGWRLLYVGRIDPRKGIPTAIQSLVELPDRATLRIIGSGDRDYLAELRALVASLGLERRVSLDDALPHRELPGAYAGCDAVVFPVEWEEPWGLVPLEAMAVGRPVAATGKGGSAEYLRNEENCLLFEAGSPGALAQALRSLAEDPGLRGRLVKEGAATAARFSETACNASIESSIRELLGAA